MRIEEYCGCTLETGESAGPCALKRVLWKYSDDAVEACTLEKGGVPPFEYIRRSQMWDLAED